MFRVGVDLGGTNIAAAVVDEQYHIISRASSETGLPRSADSICDEIAGNVSAAISAAGLTPAEITNYGIGSPGVVDVERGMVIRASNLDFTMVPLRRMLHERTGQIFCCENDANAAAYGEYIAGSGRGTRHFLALTLGTGIGGGIIINGKIYSGAGYAGGELGHSVIVQEGEPCTCGRKGCFETYASASALIRDGRRAMQQNPDSLLWDFCRQNPDRLNAKLVFDAKAAGDQTADFVIRRYIAYLSTGIANLIRTLQPEVLCIGGGISNQGQPLLDAIEEVLRTRDFAQNSTRVTLLKIAELGNDAGLIGAAFLEPDFISAGSRRTPCSIYSVNRKKGFI